MFWIFLHSFKKVINSHKLTTKTSKYKLKIFTLFHTQVAPLDHQKVQCYHTKISMRFYSLLSIMTRILYKVMFIYHFYLYLMYLKEWQRLGMSLQGLTLCIYLFNIQILCRRYVKIKRRLSNCKTNNFRWSSKNI